MYKLLGIFGFDPSKHKLSAELEGGLAAFLTMAYILAVNPSLFGAVDGMPKGAVFTATALASIIPTLLISLWARRPFGVSVGMGLNAFFVYTVCLTMGYHWQFALTAVLVEAVILCILSLTNAISKIAEAIPFSLKSAITAGIGLFIAFVGLQNMGITVKSDSTLVALGDLTSGKALLGVIGLTISCTLVMRHMKGGILIGIFATTIIGLFIKDPETGEALTRFSGPVISLPESISPLFCQYEWKAVLSPELWSIVIALLFLDMFSMMGSVLALSAKAGYVDTDGNALDSHKSFTAISIGSMFSSLLGTSNVTPFMESAAGISAGGRTGLTSFTTALCFALALLFSNVFLAIPPSATAPALIIIGMTTIQSVTNVNWSNYRESIPAFLTLIIMPMTYSISDGVFIGVIAYTVLYTFANRPTKISPLMYVLSVLFILKYIFL